MSTETPESRAQRTRTLARIVGPVLLVVPLAIITRAGALDLLFPAFFQDAPLVLITGVFTLILGFVFITAHHHWTGAAAIVLSALAWLTALRGVVLLAAPDLAAQMARVVTLTPAIAYIVAAITLVIGLWLTFVGWFSRSAP